MKVLDRYVISEMAGPFLIGVVGFVMVMTVDLLFTMADLIINKGIPLWAVLKLMLFKLPSIMVLTFPVSTLFATVMALGRLSKDNEMAALRTSGVTLFRVAQPIILLGLLVSLVSFVTNERIVPYANFVSSRIIREIIYKQPLPDVKENVFFKDPQNRYYYVHRVDTKNKTMENIMVYEATGERFPRVITAGKAVYNGAIWELQNGIVHNYDDQGFLKYESTFERMKLNVAESLMTYSDQKGAQEMSSGELKNMIAVLQRGGSSVNEYQTELLMKYAIPLTCFVFALIGIPFSLPNPRSGRTWGMVVTIVFMFTFYVFASVFRSLGKGGIISPVLAAFTPQLTFIIIGSILLAREGYFK